MNKYSKILKFFNDAYLHLVSQYSLAYLSGSNWYIGDNLINNFNFIIPPNYNLILLGFKKEYIDKSKILLYVLYNYINNLTGDFYSFFYNYDYKLNFTDNLSLKN